MWLQKAGMKASKSESGSLLCVLKIFSRSVGRGALLCAEAILMTMLDMS